MSFAEAKTHAQAQAKAVFSMSSSWILSCQKPERKSRMAKILAPRRQSRASLMQGRVDVGFGLGVELTVVNAKVH